MGCLLLRVHLPKLKPIAGVQGRYHGSKICRCYVHTHGHDLLAKGKDCWDSLILLYRLVTKLHANLVARLDWSRFSLQENFDPGEHHCLLSLPHQRDVQGVVHCVLCSGCHQNEIKCHNFDSHGASAYEEPRVGYCHNLWARGPDSWTVLPLLLIPEPRRLSISEMDPRNLHLLPLSYLLPSLRVPQMADYERKRFSGKRGT